MRDWFTKLIKLPEEFLFRGKGSLRVIFIFIKMKKFFSFTSEADPDSSKK